MQLSVKNMLIAACITAAITLAAYTILYFFTRTCCAPPPEDAASGNAKAACEAENGFFIEVLEICRILTADSGKTCADSSECEGLCLAKPTPAKIANIAAGNSVSAAGACSQWKNFFSGCFYVAKNGVLERLCAD